MQRYERLWERLLTLLGTLGEVDANEPGRLRLTIERRNVEIVMTEREWDDLVTVPYGSFFVAAQHLLRAISQAQGLGVPFLVYYNYELEPSATPKSPTRALEEADRRRIEEHQRNQPDMKGEWRAYRPGDEPT